MVCIFPIFHYLCSKIKFLHMKFIAIIPARYASTRFPGKPLAVLGGKTVIQRVYEQAVKAVSEAYVATDDERIFQAVTDFGGCAVMTRTDHKSGTDRIQEAVEKIYTQHSALNTQHSTLNTQHSTLNTQPPTSRRHHQHTGRRALRATQPAGSLEAAF